MIFIIFHQSIGVFLHIEEIGFFFCKLDFSAAVGAFAVNKLALRPERLAGSAIPTLVRAFVDVALFVEFFENFLHLLFVFFVGGADKLVVRGVHKVPNTFDFRRFLVDELLGSHSRRLCFEFYFFAVFVSAGLEEHVVSFHTFRPCDKVGKHDFVRVADVRFARRICDCGRHIEFLFVLHVIHLQIGANGALLL